MTIVRGIAGALLAFAAAFVLHIVGGALDQGWLFAVAVALIFCTATGFPVLALAITRPGLRRQRLAVLVAGGITGVGLTLATLWAANDRTFAWWQVPAAMGLVSAVSGAGLLAWAWLLGRESVSIRSARPAAGRR